MVLQDCSGFVMAYLDDITIFSRSECKHPEHIEIIFQKIIGAGLKLKESKCDFFKKEIHYLGHLISSEGIQPLPEKLDTICNMPRPKTPKEIKIISRFVWLLEKICSQVFRYCRTTV